jgi:hypothetical protein
MDADGVRVVRAPAAASARVWAMVLIAVAMIVAGVIAFQRFAAPPPSSAAEQVHGQGVAGVDSHTDQPRRSSADNDQMPPRRAPLRVSSATSSQLDDARSGDENDLASYISPDDPEPTMTEVIEALRASGEHGGLAAFNPPGTSPPLMGLAVPEDFELPPGYVRHHQVTDAGEPIEAILMFSPDHVFRDADGQPIAIPEDRVVPPELAPPGLPIRPITLPPPPE